MDASLGADISRTEPRLYDRLSVHGRCDTDTAARGDTLRQIGRDREDLAGVVRVRGVDGSRSRTNSALQVTRPAI